MSGLKPALQSGFSSYRQGPAASAVNHNAIYAEGRRRVDGQLAVLAHIHLQHTSGGISAILLAVADIQQGLLKK
jgi:hypothetical protein